MIEKERKEIRKENDRKERKKRKRKTKEMENEVYRKLPSEAKGK